MAKTVTPNLKIGIAVYIEWEDSCCASGWRSADELGELEGSACVSVGWIVKKTKRSITIAPHIGINDGVIPRQTNGHMMIPLSAIRSVKSLDLPKMENVGK